MSTVAKSYLRKNDIVMDYCTKNSHIHPAQKALQDETMKVHMSVMLGAPEVLALNKSIIKIRGGKKVLDIGMFTGASALASALALNKDCPDSKVITCDVSDTHLELARTHWKLAGVEDKIQFELGPAGDTLQKLIDNGEAGTFDFAFIDADKPGYDQYYELILQLLAPGGAIAFDNTLYFSKVLRPADPEDKEYNSVIALQNLNEKLSQDTDRVHVAQFNIGDGYTLVTKL